MYKLHNGDCLEIMPTLEDGSIDAIITDLPYGVSALKWDSVIPFEPMWKEVKRVLKPNGVFVTTASQPFTSALVMSNPEWFRYCMYWIKSPTGFLNAKKMPMLNVEEICVFCSGYTTYNPVGLVRINKFKKNGKSKMERTEIGLSAHNGGRLKDSYFQEFTNYPKQTIECPNEKGLHPTQKPTSLYEYLIRTYTNEGETVLDITMGSGTTIVAAELTGRNSIGIEKDPDIFKTAQNRILHMYDAPKKAKKTKSDNGLQTELV